MTKPFSFIIFFIFLKVLVLVAQNVTNGSNSSNGTVQVNVGVILDLQDTANKIALSCVNMGLSDFYASHAYYKTRLVIHARDAMGDDVVAAASALDLIKNVQVQAILGPANSMQANFIIDLGEKANVPIITFSASSPSLTSVRSPFFFRATQNDSNQVSAISEIVKSFSWREATIMYVDNTYGLGVVPYLTDALQSVNCHVMYRSTIPPQASDVQIEEELYKLMTMQTRVFIVHMLPSLGTRIFQKASEIGMMSEGYVWILTDGMTDLLPNIEATQFDSLQGALGVKPYIRISKRIDDFRVRWKNKFIQENPTIIDPELDIYSFYGYDAATALARAIEKAGTANLAFQEFTSNSTTVTDLEKVGVSQNGQNLLQALSDTTFRGLAGDFRFIDGQLPISTYQIVNVIGNGARTVGYWTPTDGLVKTLTKKNTANTNYSTSKNSLSPIIFPGDTTFVPKGWQIPTNGQQLRVGVPAKGGFGQFVMVSTDNSTNRTTVTGYSIDVFEAVMNALPYAVSYKYIPFVKPDGSPAGTYNDLLYQVYLGNYDAVAGDTTIVANRSLYVDFTLPYTESGVSMIVPIVDSNPKNAWVFLKPLTWDLWVTTFCFFLFIGFAVYVIEHRINEEFRGPPSHQIGTSLWYSFSTMVFAHKEALLSNLSRTVIIIWCFVVLILTQSYTASLTSLLTVQQLTPKVTSVNDLIKSGDFVGYQEGSFVQGILLGLGFQASKLMVYNSPEDLDALLTKGSGNGGIAAAFDEIPYSKLFLSQYCDKYTSIEPTFKTDGFGFVFPIGSPLVSDVSRAVLNVTEGQKMNEIEKAWFGSEAKCSDTSASVTSNSLSLGSFWGLFLIAGGAALLALSCHIVLFSYRHRQILLVPDGMSPLRRIARLSTVWYEPDLTAFSMRHRVAHNRSSALAPQANSAEALSPSALSVHTDFTEELVTPRTPPANEYSFPSPSRQQQQQQQVSPRQLVHVASLNQPGLELERQEPHPEQQAFPEDMEITLSPIQISSLMKKATSSTNE